MAAAAMILWFGGDGREEGNCLANVSICLLDSLYFVVMDRRACCDPNWYVMYLYLGRTITIFCSVLDNQLI